MKELFILIAYLLTTLAKLVPPGGVRAVTAESLVLMQSGHQTAFDVYAAFSQDGGVTFGANDLAQDAFAEGFSQWHPAIAGGRRGQIVIAWDDDRDDTSSIW